MSTTAQMNGHAPTPAAAPNSSLPNGETSKIQASDVGFQFVPQYYAFVNKHPGRLHCFYNKRSSFSHGVSGEDAPIARGQIEIHERIAALNFNQCKVFVNSIDSQSSANGGVVILVIGEMSNGDGAPWRKFVQTFFLAEQPNGYFVLNDIFRYLKEDDEEEVEEQAGVEQQGPLEITVPSAIPEKIAEPVKEVTQETAVEPAPEPAPNNEPAPTQGAGVPEEAIVAAVPDKDVSPADPPIIHEPETASSTTPDAPIESTPSIAPAPSVRAPSPAAPAVAPIANGNTAPAPATAPTAAPSPAPVPAAAPTPAAPAKPAAPKTWASMAAAGSGKPAWGAVAATPSQPVATTAAPAAAPAPKPAEQAAPAAAAGSSSASQGRHSSNDNVMKITTNQCFVKLPNWSIDNPTGGDSVDETTVRNIAARFGEVKKVEIVKHKACAFVEFATVDAARKAITASLPANQGGEGGVKFSDGKLNFETRKEKDERRPKGTRGGAPDGRGPTRGGSRMGGNREGEVNGHSGGGGGGGGGGGHNAANGGGGGGSNRGRGRARVGGPGEGRPQQQAK
ncbi:hypothetical protein M231_06031 [Tremella mesenterica]|uniref:RAN protein binding protein n=1 Tax=Tremella mesenterica TaxID=5217 RepID=A0A4Q1BGM4_TREME|nr:hypothetical protein M231_06031 [Tremella mesenterica]